MNKKLINVELVEDDDFVVYCDTDSAFSLAEPYIKVLYPDIDTTDEEKMSNIILKVSSDVISYINKNYDVLAKRLFFIEKHYFFIKQEYIAKTALWIAKKRYVQHIINENGIPRNEIKPVGLDIVRSSFPEKFKVFMEEMLRDILTGKDKDYIDNMLLEFKDKLKTFHPREIAKNTSVTFYCKTTGVKFDPKNRNPFEFVKGTTAQVKASLAYNDFLKRKGLDKKVQPILSGSKIKWVYCKENSFGIDCIAFKDDGTDPKEIMTFIENYIDRSKIFNKEFLLKLEDFYNAMKWEQFNENTARGCEFFG